MEKYCELVKELIKRNYNVSAAESCTGGLFAAGIVAVPDASKVLGASFVTYSEEAKNKFAFVSFDTIENFGVVSCQVALEMARGASKNGNAQVGVGITGYAGPSGGDSFAEKGTVCFGFVTPEKEYTVKKLYKDKSRNEIRTLAADFATETLIDLLK